MSAIVDPDQLAAEVQQILRSYGTALDLAVDEAAMNVGKEAAKELRATSPKGFRGKYAKGWTVKREKKGTVIVYNKEYRLTHLLEHGHPTRLESGKYGNKAQARAIEHIAPVAAEVEKDFVEEINNQLKL